MSLRARKGLHDANHAELAHVFEECYCTVIDTTNVGFGFPDMVVGFRGVTALVEVKTEDGKLDPKQERFIRDWRGGKVWVVRDRDDVLDCVKDMQERGKRL